MIFKLKKTELLSILENTMSFIVVFAMFIYGFGKIIQFEDGTPVNKMVSEMSGHQLMWAFYGYSKYFIFTLGFLEVTGGFLILIKRTRLLGCIFISTILVNIILQDIFYHIPVGALKAAILYQILIIIILWLHKNKIIKAFNVLLIKTKEKIKPSRQLLLLTLAFLLFVIFRVVEYYITIKW
jgi:hypothetical protein